MKLNTLVLALGLFACSTAHAQSENSLKSELRVFANFTAGQCASVKAQAAALKPHTDPLIVYNLKDAVESLCICVPAQTTALTLTLTPAQLARPVTEAELLSVLKPYAVDRCASQQLRAIYRENCRERFKNSSVDALKYCACMNQAVSEYTDAETAEIATAASDYLPRAAEAEKNGEPVPERPPILEAYFQSDRACKGKPE
ncbi:MAG TPA: hypothetical protein VGO61_07150 [Steroidobacteraceae bacterium]|jgi:hypothetical protein|nr:hypothetical protein [Steroidobacteraceae bacterium]